jgi:hypothetical protein
MRGVYPHQRLWRPLQGQRAKKQSQKVLNPSLLGRKHPQREMVSRSENIDVILSPTKMPLSDPPRLMFCSLTK